MNRRLAIVASVALFHFAALWALQTGLLRRTAEIVVPAQILSEFIRPPAPKTETPAPQPPLIKPQPRPTQKTPMLAPPTPQPVAVAPPEPVPAAPSGIASLQPRAPALAAPLAATPAAPAAPPAPARLEPPSSDAAYLNNPKPPYPALSKRLGEQGKVVLRVLIGVDGTAQQAEIRTSSGYERLDQAALATVLKWRYVPGKRGGVPEAMWFNVPINFVLE